ncbi:MAG: alcohol dehydrogenase catalytic domain-containing protein, partial [Chloroflexota bacterium]
MKAGILEGREKLTVREVPDPEMTEGSVVVKVKACSICSTDLRIYHYGHAKVKLPQILGHEIAGEVAAVSGSNTGYRLGERVAVTPRMNCGHCFYCRREQPVYCQNNLTFGYQLPGGYAEYLLVPPHGVELGVLNRFADTLSFAEAALAEPLSCCLRAQRNSGVSPGDTVVVIGGGPIGVMHCRLARLNQAGQVLLVERETRRLKGVNLDAVDSLVDAARGNPAAEIATRTGDRGAEVVRVACSSRQAQTEAFTYAGRGGRINFFGGLPPGEANLSLDSNLIHYREVSVLGAHGSAVSDNREALELLSGKRLEVSDLVT